MTVLQLTDLSVGYRTRHRIRSVLDGVNAQVQRGALVGLVGPNGAGKSTLLRTVAGLQPALQGFVSILGMDVRRIDRSVLARQLAVVLTDPVDAGRLTVADVVGLGRHPRTGWSGRLNASDWQAVTAALEAVGAGKWRSQMMWELSDGQRQRVMIARALAQEPRLLLLDEPTAFLDPPARIRTFELLQDLAHDRQLAVLVCTHDVEVAARYADQLWVVGGGPGMRYGTPTELARSGAIADAFGHDVDFDETFTFTSSRRHAGDNPAA